MATWTRDTGVPDPGHRSTDWPTACNMARCKMMKWAHQVTPLGDNHLNWLVDVARCEKKPQGGIRSMTGQNHWWAKVRRKTHSEQAVKAWGRNETGSASQREAGIPPRTLRNGSEGPRVQGLLAKSKLHHLWLLFRGSNGLQIRGLMEIQYSCVSARHLWTRGEKSEHCPLL